ncbi:unnamed protein product, partial [Symbiodinium microadriaticum]
ICTYSGKADYVDQPALRRLAAPVASWIAYGPRGRIPTMEELQLLTKFLDKMDGGLLPSRLSIVLSEMKAVLQSLPRQADEAWNKVEKRLQRSYRKLHRRCSEPASDAVAVAADDDHIADVELEAEQEEAVQVREADISGSSSTSVRSDQHLMLFRKMNEWGFLDNTQKLERLQQAEEASRHSGRSLSQEELTDVLNVAAACLAAPRRHARLPHADATDGGDVRTVPESQEPTTIAFQKRVRSLLLHALRMWQMNQLDCKAIEHVLDSVQQKINKFENKVGEIQGAAAGKAWLKIKHMVEELLRAETPSNPHVHGAAKDQEKAGRRVNVRLERQSGIQNITWAAKQDGWLCQRSYVKGSIRRQTARVFPISKFLGQGLGEEAAVEAALQEAKAYREELVRQGKLRPPKPKPPSSTVRGVFFDKSAQKWQVQMYHPVHKKRVHGGYFAEKAEAEVKGREMARQLGVLSEYEVRPAKRSRAEVP